MKENTKKLRTAIAGVGNCASSLIQGLEYYSQKKQLEDVATLGLMTPTIGGSSTQRY